MVCFCFDSALYIVCCRQEMLIRYRRRWWHQSQTWLIFLIFLRGFFILAIARESRTLKVGCAAVDEIETFACSCTLVFAQLKSRMMLCRYSARGKYTRQYKFYLHTKIKRFENWTSSIIHWCLLDIPRCERAAALNSTRHVISTRLHHEIVWSCEHNAHHMCIERPSSSSSIDLTATTRQLYIEWKKWHIDFRRF